MNLHKWLYNLLTGEQFTLYGGSSSGGGATNVMDAASQQGQQSQDMAAQQTWANRPNQSTPWGQTQWSSALTKDPATGADVTQWTQNQTLDPTLQNALTQQFGMIGNKSQLANQMMPRVGQDLSKPFDWNAAPAMGGAVGAQNTQGTPVQGGIDTTTQTTDTPGFLDQRNQVYQNQMDMMQPSQQQAQQSFETQMANQGLAPGSEAYNRASAQLQSRQSADRFNALNNATGQQQALNSMLLGQQQQAFGQGQAAGQFGNQAASQTFNQNLQANNQNFGQQMQSSGYQNQLRQQALAEQAQARGMGLNELNAVMGGTQINPAAMPSFGSASAASAPNYASAANAQNQYAQSQQPDYGTLLGTGLSAWLGK